MGGMTPIHFVRLELWPLQHLSQSTMNEHDAETQNHSRASFMDLIVPCTGDVLSTMSFLCSLSRMELFSQLKL